jgi:hypothetical protein
MILWTRIPWTRSRPADFAEILADLERSRAPEPSGPVAVASACDAPPGTGAPESAFVRRAGTGFSNRSSRIWSSFPWRRIGNRKAEVSRIAAAYAQEAAEHRSAEEPPAFEPRAIPRDPPRSENEVIAEELGLTRHLDTADLRQLRRDFAKQNHPDRCTPAQRPRAARRMSIANMLIDAALKQRP